MSQQNMERKFDTKNSGGQQINQHKNNINNHHSRTQEKIPRHSFTIGTCIKCGLVELVIGISTLSLFYLVLQWQ